MLKTCVKPSSRKQVEFRQLCAIALDRFDANGLADWTEAVKVRCARMGYDYSPVDVVKAIAAVQKAHRLEFKSAPKAERPATPGAPTKTEAAEIIKALYARIGRTA